MSLLEVLVSIGVLTVGLLGFALLIPVGRFEVAEAAKSDFSGACGRAALREVKVRRMLDPTRWSALPPGGLDATSFSPFAIDPLGVAQVRTPQDPPEQPFALVPGMPPVQGMPRLTFAYWASIPNKTLQRQKADRVFLWRDPVMLNMPNDATQRPRGLFMHDANPNPATMNETPSDDPAVEGSYSWLLTAVPSTSEATGGVTLQYKTRFSVSVAVCWKRTFDSDGEITATVQAIPAIGCVTLKPPVAGIKVNQWVMLYGAKAWNANGQQGIEYDCRWYRVIAASDPMDDPAGGGPMQMLTLAGPDWKFAPNETVAKIIRGVVGVYSTTMDLDRDPVWTKW